MVKKLFITVVNIVLLLSVVVAQSTDEELANQYFSEKEYDKAVVYYQKLFNRNGDRFYKPLFNCYLELEEFKNAEKLVKKQQKQQAFDMNYKADLAHVYARSGKKSAEESYINSLLKGLPINSQLINELAVAFLRYQDLETALGIYQQGRKLMKGSYAFNMEIAEIYNLQGNTSKMVEEYMEVLVFQESFLQSVQNALQTSLYSSEDEAKKEILKSQLIRYIQKHPDKRVFSEMLVWNYIQDNNYKGALLQTKALDKRFKESGQRVMSLAGISASNKDYNIAIEAYKYVINKGPDNYNYITAKMNLVDVYRKKITGAKYNQDDLNELKGYYLSTINELGKTAYTSPLLQGLAELKAFYLYDAEGAIEMLNEALSIGGMKPKNLAEIKIDLADVYLFQGEIWEASLLYSQVEKAFKYDQLGERAKYKNAKISFYTGDFQWAKAQLDVLKASTSKLIANDAMQLSILITDNIGIDTTTAPLLLFAEADLLAYQNKHKEALQLLDSLANTFPIHTINDDILYKKYQINYKTQELDKAVENLEQIIKEYSYDILADDAIYHLAKIYDNELDKKDKAAELYKKIMFDFQDSIYGVESRKRYRELNSNAPKIIDIKDDTIHFEAN